MEDTIYTKRQTLGPPRHKNVDTSLDRPKDSQCRYRGLQTLSFMKNYFVENLNKSIKLCHKIKYFVEFFYIIN
jgi:hypothetical protein